MNFIITSMLAFISTNIDDTFLLMLFFGNKRFKTHEIITGQYVGIGLLIGVSLILSLIGLIIGAAYLGLLGFIPIYIGIRGLIGLRKTNSEEVVAVDSNAGKNNILVVSGVTIANGGDNIGIYVPLFAAITWEEKTTMIFVFLFMTGLLCVLAKYLTAHPAIAKAIDRFGHIVTPIILILLGVFILYESDAASLIMQNI